jgi:hypothetical protein
MLMAPLVDVAFATAPLDPNPVWTDITRYCDFTAAIAIGRGRADERSQIVPGSCAITVDNSDARFTPNNASSPYYPGVRKSRRIRVRVASVDTNYVQNPTFETSTATWSRLAPAAEPDLYTSTTQAHSGTRSLLVPWGGANLISVNPAFESGITGWIPHNAATISAASGGTSGTGVGRGTSTTLASSTGIKIATPITPITPGEVFQFTFDIFPIAASVTPLIAVQWYDAGGTVVDTSVTTAATQSAGSWHTLTATASTAVGTAVSARPLISVNVIPVGNSFDADTVLFQRVAVPATQGTQTELAGLTIGTQYTASAWVYVPTGSPAVRLGVAGIGTGTASTSTNAWQQITYTFTATSTTHYLQVTPSTAPSAGGTRVWVDDVQVNVGAAALAFSSLGATVSARYDGYVNEWPTDWPNGGKMSVARLTCTDIFKPLEKATLRSMIEEEILSRHPLAYYPLSEPANSESVGDVSENVNPSLTVLQVGSGGTLAFGSGTGAPADGLGAAEFTPIDVSNGRLITGDLGTAVEAATLAQPTVIEAWFTSDTAGGTIAAMRSADGVNELIMSLDSTTGQLRVQTIRTGTGSSSTLWGTASLADGRPHHVLFNEGTTHVFVDGVDKGTGAVTGVQSLRYLSIGGYKAGGLWQGTIAHVAVYADGGTHADVQALAHYTAGFNGYEGDTADRRVIRLGAFAGIDPTQITTSGTLFGAVAGQGAGAKSTLSLMREVETTEACQLFGGRGGGLVLQARDVRYAPTIALTLSANDVEGGLRFSDTDQFLANEVTGSRSGGATVRLVNAASRTEYGRTPLPLNNLLKTTDAGVAAAVSWQLQRYADPLPRLPAVPVEAYTLGVTVYRQLLALDISSVFTVTNLPTQSPGSGTENVIVEGYQEKIGNNDHRINFYTSPASLDHAWILGDATYSVLGSTTILAY